MRVILGAAVNSPIDLVLRADNCTNLGMLWVFIHSPGLIRRIDTRRWILTDEQYHDLLTLGFAENVGHSMTFKVYNVRTKTVLYRSVVKKIQGDLDRNRRVMGDDGNNDNAPGPNDPSPPSRVVLGSDNTRCYAGFNPESLIGRTFLMNPQEDGTVKRAKIVECLEEHENETGRHPERKRFRCEVGDDKFEEYLSYSDMCNFIEEQEQNENGTWNFRNIMDHRAVKTGRRTKHQVLIEWESGEITWENISSIYTTNKYIYWNTPWNMT